MPTVEFQGQCFALTENETVLDNLQRNGHDIPSGCRAGVCQACILVAEHGDLPTAAQQGLSEPQKQLKQFLSCQCKPTEALSVRRDNSINSQTQATVIAKNWLNPQVLQLKLKADLNYMAGQYITLWKSPTLARSYSLASCPKQEPYLELHIKHIANGQFSDWACKHLQLGDTLAIQGALGRCIYTADTQQNLLLSAIGTGLAPIYGILKDALNQGHQGNIDVIIGSKSCDGFYLVEQLQNIAATHANVNVYFVSQSDSNHCAQQDDIYSFSKNHCGNMKNWRVFLCGSESFVKKMKRNSFMAGANMADISADVFLPFGV